MDRNQFAQFSEKLRRLGAAGVESHEFDLGKQGPYRLQYIPFEHVNRAAKLVIVGITPGPTQLRLAYDTAQRLLQQSTSTAEILTSVKKIGAFGGPSMRPNLLKMLRYFRFDKLLKLQDVEALWSENSDILHSTSVVPHAAFKNGKMFAGSFDEVITSPLLRECFVDCFVATIKEIGSQALFVALGPCPEAALNWCVDQGHLERDQVLGAFCHPSTSGGSKTRYYLRGITREALDPQDPTRSQCDWLDQAYEQMRISMSRLGAGPDNASTIGFPSRTRNTKSSKSPAPGASTERKAPPTNADLDTLCRQFEAAGYKTTKETKKLREFRWSGHTAPVYLVKASSHLNQINVMVHPELTPHQLEQLPGVSSVSAEHRFHSNMTHFPKRLNRGVVETAFGWQVTMTTISDLDRFLAGFRALRC